MKSTPHASTTGRGDALVGALPAHVSPKVRTALAEAKERLQATYGDRLRRVVLYGPRARRRH